MNIWEVVILAIIEGLTEFLPVSSTGHMILASSFMGIADDDFVKMFTVAIQFGAILSVIILYYKKFIQSLEFYFKLFVAFIPAAILGFLLNDHIDAMLESAATVAISLLVGGVFLLFIDKMFKGNNEDQPTYKSAFIIGFFQVMAMIPGVSRSAATIIGGMQQGFSRKVAAEFSFFLAVPTMFAATLYKIYKFHSSVGFEQAHVLPMLLGNVVAFIVAMLAIKGFISYLTKYGFKVFGYYRIILGAVILILLLTGQELNVM